MGIISDASIVHDIFGTSAVLAPCTCHEIDEFYSPVQQPKGYVCNNALRTDSAAKGAEKQSTLQRATMQIPTERRVYPVIHGSPGILRRVPADD
jgi:hypothetical protein